MSKYAIFIEQGMMWELVDGTDPEILGLLPSMFSTKDPAPAVEQADRNYHHGGGWHPLKGHKLEKGEDGRYILLYRPNDPEPEPDEETDPPLHELARAELRDELLLLFDYGFMVVKQKDDSFEIARMD